MSSLLTLPIAKRGSLAPRARVYRVSRLQLMLMLLIGAGILQRVARYFLAFPIWGDEAFVCLNILDRSPLELTGRLRFDQVAPILYLWTEWAVLRLLGTSELALRLPSLLAGIGSLLLFTYLARRCLSRKATLIAVGILAVSYYPVRHSCEVKPYAFDLLMTLLLMIPAIIWLRQPQRRGPLVLLVLLVPFTLASSYPAVFTAGAISLALLPTVRRERVWGWFVLYNILLATTFLSLYAFIGSEQHGSMVGSSGGYWDEGFPPGNPFALLSWLLDAHTGTLFAYPFGGRNGGSTLTFLCCLIGIVSLCRSRRYPLLTLLTAPFLLHLIAASLHKYPYGPSARVAQHLAPSICLLAGLGIATLVRRRPRPIMALAFLLLLASVVGVVRDVRKPWKTPGDEQARRLIQQTIPRVDSLVIHDAPPRLYPSLEWYLRTSGMRLRWTNSTAGILEDNSGETVICLHFLTNESPSFSPQPRLKTERGTWLLQSNESHPLSLGEEADATKACEIWQWTRGR